MCRRVEGVLSGGTTPPPSPLVEQLSHATQARGRVVPLALVDQLVVAAQLDRAGLTLNEGISAGVPNEIRPAPLARAPIGSFAF